ncbi:periplasmic heavy metal sensor [Pseudooceanicola sp. HF7]|uniref:periplasmic heavy metal sensor n=1 Tax=Pseudooceanicola sp. HF7 TaxID=2721560 RepID=UPI00142FFFB0|nr:periplasmic heavy metal sensor [Pseudooceanicola sp. HF7]NIZ10137.1 periplasmic heavy metal sensor [Pseudooceanicola sp. HF7]
MKIAFFISLALNLAVAGMVGGAILRGHGEHGPRSRPPGADRFGGVIAYALSPEDRRWIGREIGREMRERRPERDVVRAEFERILGALRSDPYEADVLEDSMERQLEEAMRRLGLGQKVLLERLAEMSREERLAVADRLEEVLRRPLSKRHSDD